MFIFDRENKTKKPLLDRRRSLEGVPVLNQGITVTSEVPGRARITVRSPRGKGLLSHFQPAVMERNVKLDELGTFVFSHIDGRKDVLEIVEAFVDRYRTNRREAELSVVAFLRSLATRNVISIVIK